MSKSRKCALNHAPKESQTIVPPLEAERVDNEDQVRSKIEGSVEFLGILFRKPY